MWMPWEPLCLSHGDCELTDLEDRKHLEIKPFTETVKLWFISLGYFTRRNIFSESCPCYFHIRNIGPSTLPFVDCPRVARHTRAREMEGDRRVSRLQVWLWRQRDKFQVCSLLLPIVFFFLILYHYFSFPIKLERLMEKWAYLVNDATSTVVE